MPSEEPLENLEAAVGLYEQARQCFPANSPSYGLTQLNEGTVREELAGWGIEPLENLETAVGLYEQARQCFPPHSPRYGLTQLNEGTARTEMAKWGMKPLENLETAVGLYEQARQCFPPHSPRSRQTQVNEGVCRTLLADEGITPVENLRKAAALFAQAADNGLIGSPAWGATRCNQATVLHRLGQSAEAYQRLKEGLETVERTRAQIHRAHERITFLETMAQQYATMVHLCLALAGEATAPEQAARWRWEAWHWGHRGKSRTLLELLANARPRLTEDDYPLWEECQRLAQALDKWEREVLLLRQVLKEGSDLLRASLQREATRRLAAVTAEWRDAQQRSDVLQRVEGARALLTVDVPPPARGCTSPTRVGGDGRGSISQAAAGGVLHVE